MKRKRLSGNGHYDKDLECELCKCSIIKNGEAMMPIYYEDAVGVRCPAHAVAKEMNLPLGAVLIDKKPVPRSEYLSIIICKVDKGERWEFVTWVYNHEFEGCVSGHYFNSLINAAKDFEERR